MEPEQQIEAAQTVLDASGNGHLWHQMTSEWNLLLLGLCWLGIQFVTDRLAPEFFSAQPDSAPWWRHLPHRLKPVYALPICVVAYSFVPGPWIDDTLPLQQRALLGACGGFAVGQGHKIITSLAPLIPIPAARTLVLSLLGSPKAKAEPATKSDSSSEGTSA